MRDREIVRQIARVQKQVDGLVQPELSASAVDLTYDPDSKPGTPSAYDDEFETGALDAKWTAINCAAGTVDLLSLAAAQDTYDLATYSGMLILQPGTDPGGAGGAEAQAAIVRQTVVLAGTCKVLCKINFASTVDTGGLTAAAAGIILSGATGFNDNNYLWGCVGSRGGLGTGNALAVGEHNIGGAGATQINADSPATEVDYLMITKTVNDFSVWAGDGRNWVAMTDGLAPDVTAFTFGAGVMVRLSLFCYYISNAGEPGIFNPYAAFDYFRYFTNNTPHCNA